MSRRRLTRRQWRKLVEQQRDGGLSVSAFCAEHDVGASTFFAWRRRLARARGRVRVRVRGRGREPAFVELRANAPQESETSGPIEVVLCSGVTLRVRESIDAATLRRIAEVLS